MIGCVLYVTVDANLLLAVLPHLTPMARRLGFLTARSFREQLLAAPVTTEATRAMVTLEEFLQYSHPLYIGSGESTVF
jgi:ethanolamine utilization microcompartment shell protein EutL